MNEHRLVAPLILKNMKVVTYKNIKVSCSLRASSLERSGGKAGKGRKAYNYVSGI